MKTIEINNELQDKFHSPECLEVYLYAKSKAELINKYLKLGYLVLDEDGVQFKNPFFFENKYGEYTISSKNVSYLCDSWDEDGKIWIYEKSDKEPQNKEFIDKMFNEFSIVKPKNIIKI